VTCGQNHEAIFSSRGGKKKKFTPVDIAKNGQKTLLAAELKIGLFFSSAPEK